MDLKQALQIVGSLEQTSKMPCPSWSISTQHCQMGAILAKLNNTVCERCYADRGRYRTRGVQRALERRLQSFFHPYWTPAISFIIQRYAFSHFRWFCSGDLQSLDMFYKIVQVAQATPGTQHWLPTQQRNYVDFDIVPSNLTIRISNIHINSLPDSRYKQVSIVSTIATDIGYMCPATFTKPHICGSCRACWDKNIPIIIYKAH